MTLKQVIADERARRFLAERPEYLNLLTERQRRIVTSRWLPHGDRLTYEQLGRELGNVARERIRALERDAVEIVNMAADDDVRKCSHCDGKGWV